MTAGTTTFRILTIPEVRVCCLRCEELGTRYGAWVPLDEADNVCADQVHRGRVVPLTRGVDLHVDAPTAVLETRNMPVSGPLSAAQLTAWQGLYETVGESSWPALLAWVDAGVQIEDGDGLPSAGDFTERYAGTWENFEAYARALAEEVDLQAGWSETARTYFDWSRWARDIRYGYTVVDGPQGGVCVFRDL